jgi:hypothetical protein
MSWSGRSKPAKIAIIIGAVLVACLLIGYSIHLSSKNTVEEYKQRLRAAGEKLEVNELIPPRVPPDQNGADLLIQAANLVNYPGILFYTNPPPAMRLVAPGKAMIGWKQPDIRDSEGTNSWDEADAACKQFGVALELLRQSTALPAFDFELDYRQGAKLLLPHLIKMKHSAQFLSAASACDLHRGDFADAVTNVDTMIALVRNWNHEPILISDWVRFSMTQLAWASNWELLQSSDVSDQQLAMLQSDWSELEFMQSAQNTLSMERAMGEVTIENFRGSNSPLESLSMNSGGSGSGGSSGNWLADLSDQAKAAWRGTKLKSKNLLWRASWSYTDELHALQGKQVLLDVVRLVQTNGFFKNALAAQKKGLDDLGFSKITDADGSPLFSFFDSDPADIDPRWAFSSDVLTLNSHLNKLLAAETAKQLAITAIALKRYQLRHGTLPSELSALVPEFLLSVSRDPVDGQPLRYHLNSDGTFLLYSIGKDGVDDGGDARSANYTMPRSWQRGRDLVWPQPATAKEIQDYEDDLATRR